MKRLLIVVATGLICIVGCKEQDPVLTFHTGNFVDTSYQSSVPASDAHNVLIEEFTGQGCSNCPGAHSSLEAIATTNPGRINIIGLYIFNFGQTVPPNHSKNDLRDSIATTISSSYFGTVGALPTAGIDREPQGGSILLGQNSWNFLVNSQLMALDSVNLSVLSSYDPLTKKATIITTVTYTKDVSTKQNLSLALVEDSIIDFQEYPPINPTYPSGFDTFYVFTNIFRDMVTVTNVPYGDPILDKLPTKKAGYVDQRTYTYTLPAIPTIGYPTAQQINPAHCRIIAFVNSNNGADVHIMQSAQCKFAP